MLTEQHLSRIKLCIANGENKLDSLNQAHTLRELKRLGEEICEWYCEATALLERVDSVSVLKLSEPANLPFEVGFLNLSNQHSVAEALEQKLNVLKSVLYYHSARVSSSLSLSGRRVDRESGTTAVTDLTREEYQLLHGIVARYQDGESTEFVAVSSQEGMRVIYRKAQLNLNVTESDFLTLERFGYITLRKNQQNQLVGKPTAKGLRVFSQQPNALAASNSRSIEPPPSPQTKPPKVFIGHGRSREWLVLKDLLTELGLDCSEFNSVCVAGIHTTDRLKEMLDEADFAFLVMTGEVDLKDGLHPRENVIHELGLFQAQLGYERAIILKEEGCVLSSNLDGLTHIPFHKNDIKTAFEDIRRVLGREGIIGS